MEEEINLWDLVDTILKHRKKVALITAIAMFLALMSTFIFQPIAPQTTARLAFLYPSFERGLYPDGSRFQAEDLLAPDLISTALQQAGLSGSNMEVTKFRSYLAIHAIIPDNIIKMQD